MYLQVKLRGWSCWLWF